MPYIKQEDRAYLNGPIDALIIRLRSMPADAQGGALNYAVTRILLSLVEQRYASMRSFVGDLTCCLLEFYRRHVGPYEDIKIQENGDVEGR